MLIIPLIASVLRLIGRSKLILSVGFQSFESDKKLPVLSNANEDKNVEYVIRPEIQDCEDKNAEYSPGDGRDKVWPFNEAFAPLEYVHGGILNFKVDVPVVVLGCVEANVKVTRRRGSHETTWSTFWLRIMFADFQFRELLMYWMM